MSEWTRSDAVRCEQREDGTWFARFNPPIKDYGMWGQGETSFEAINDLSEALSEAAQIFSEAA